MSSEAAPIFLHFRFFSRDGQPGRHRQPLLLPVPCGIYNPLAGECARIGARTALSFAAWDLEVFNIIVSLTAICRVLERALSPRGRCAPRRSGTTNMFSAPTVCVPVHTSRYGAWEPCFFFFKFSYERKRCGCLSVGIRVCSLYFKAHLIYASAEYCQRRMCNVA